MRIAVHLLFLVLAPLAQAAVSVEIDLSTQTAWILQDGQRVYESPISSGQPNYETPAGEFVVLEKDREHRSTLYGRIVAADGSVLKANAHSAMPIPEGATFESAPMKWFVRFNGSIGMHAGRLPGRAASHGCIRLPTAKARLFYDIVTIGTPVRVLGSAPGREQETSSSTTTLVQVTPPTKPPVAKRWLSWFQHSPKQSPSENSQKQSRLEANPELLKGTRKLR